jgi:hypothetical protein
LRATWPNSRRRNKASRRRRFEAQAETRALSGDAVAGAVARCEAADWPARMRRAIPGRGQLNIPPDSVAGIWQKGFGAEPGFIRAFRENS